MPGAPSGLAGDSTSYLQQPNGDLSQSEAISNISSPDFQEEETLDILSTRDLMEVSDPSDSDSTLLVSDRTPAATAINNNNPQHLHHLNNNKNQNPSSVLADGVHLHSNVVGQGAAEHRIVIQVKGPDKDVNVLRAPNSPRGSGKTHRGGAVPPLAGREQDFMYSMLSAQQTSRSPTTLSSGNVTPELVGYQVRRDIHSFALRIVSLKRICPQDIVVVVSGEFYFFFRTTIAYRFQYTAIWTIFYSA